eukprot:TRINITY_DN78533_c0_g1_i1.p1 TRINITY_DN78533_c0_g1~~TRINITY_DN78533_c0_g1_i1.p1  ORF type:complete len:256 (+),score=46.73 TRINITY_DN78533_c0_g1_i1:43-810(+)
MAQAGSHYAILELSVTATPEEVRKAHKLLALKWHPDKVSDPNDEVAIRVATQQFQLVQAAYEVLSDAEKRSQYDRQHGFSEAAAQAPWKKGRSGATGPSPQPTVPAGWAHTKAESINVPGDVENIAAAVDQLSVTGGTIHVSAGCYHGLIVVSKPFVKIICTNQQSEKAVVKGQIVFRQCAMGAHVQGLCVSTSCVGGAIDLKGVVGDVTIEDCDICNSESAGVVLEGSSGTTKLLNCRVHDCKFDGQQRAHWCP